MEVRSVTNDEKPQRMISELKELVKTNGANYFIELQAGVVVFTGPDAPHITVYDNDVLAAATRLKWIKPAQKTHAEFGKGKRTTTNGFILA